MKPTKHLSLASIRMKPSIVLSGVWTLGWSVFSHGSLGAIFSFPWASPTDTLWEGAANLLAAWQILLDLKEYKGLFPIGCCDQSYILHRVCCDGSSLMESHRIGAMFFSLHGHALSIGDLQWGWKYVGN